MGFKKIDISELNFNPFTKIGKEWLLISARDGDNFNTMTASWGGLGVIWNKNVATVYIRPQRYTKQFVDNQDYFTLSFFDSNYKKELGYLGRVSGKDEDKIKTVGFHPVIENNAVYFDESDLVFVCKKLYRQSIEKNNFIDQTLIDKNYPNKDFHDLYIGEIVEVLIKE